MGRLRPFAFGKFVFAFAFSMSTLVLGLDANAYMGQSWCEEDPVFMVNGALVDVTTSFPAGYTSTLVGPVEFELLVPWNSTAAVVSLPAAVPTTAKISKVLPSGGLLSVGVPVIVKVTIRATETFDTMTKVTGTYLWLSSTAYGASNVTTQVRYTLIGL
jgi:hypothetical protein